MKQLSKQDPQQEVLKSRIYKYQIPQNIGVGLAIRKDFFMAGIDFERSNWSSINFKNPLIETRNSNRYSFGVEFPSLGHKKGNSKDVLVQIWCRVS